jgi:secreted trypsin-like serine protease
LLLKQKNRVKNNAFHFYENHIDEKSCGGSIISPSWVITAAHCMKNALASDINVYAGSNNFWSGNQIRNGLRVIVHPNYDSITLSNDIALIKLSYPLEVTNSSIHTICLPSINSTILSYSE